MYSALLSFLMLIQCAIGFAQTECNRFVVKSKKPFQNIIYQSDSALTFSLGKEVIGKMLINDAGKKETVNFDFTFTDMQRRPVEMQDILTIHFKDQKAEFIARSKRAHSGKITFAIVRQTETRLGTVLTDEDEIFYQKLKSDPIMYFELNGASKNHKMLLVREQAEWLRTVINCLGKRRKY